MAGMTKGSLAVRVLSPVFQEAVAYSDPAMTKIRKNGKKKMR